MKTGAVWVSSSLVVWSQEDERLQSQPAFLSSSSQFLHLLFSLTNHSGAHVSGAPTYSSTLCLHLLPPCSMEPVDEPVVSVSF